MTEPLPMLASPSTGSGNRQPIDVRTLVGGGGWAVDTKMDGLRAFAFWDGTTLRLVNRNGVDITHKFPELLPAAKAQCLPADWYDGEIICDNGSFETVLTRDKQEKRSAIAAMAESHPARFVAFDLPGVPHEPWSARRNMLESYGLDGRWQITPVGYTPAFVDQVAELGLEGVIAKRLSSRYQFGKRSRDWVKHKNVHRISCLAKGYEPGTGSRAHFGAMLLALVGDEGQIVPCGRVGTGFTGPQTYDLKARLDAAQILVVEIECLNVTSGGVLRFPVFKGIRSDLGVLDCTTDQLKTLPTC